ncbi:ferrous iron transport protein A [Pacificimonas sp. WHA3]|uniref:Ferrous iron transport protein A n=1 Tax=Pacificimonas pallii TaxID=2827236 RepID=A0ABS6SCP7_9SPHN|nr:FeoA family protein [Pacificimonas pallii]MBV7256193.1 ferrous iron transport protein A [Pacificimonas pallii]
MRIDQLTPGTVAHIVAIDLDELGERRLREHGLDEGVEVELLHRAAFGADPLAVRVGNACVAMRRSQAAGVTVRVAQRLEAAE